MMSHSRLPVAVVALAAALALAACTSTRQAMIERGHPPAYAEGYEHGCASGKEAAGGLFAEARKDQSRYQDSDSQYARGWDAGFEECRREMAAMVWHARTRNPSAED